MPLLVDVNTREVFVKKTDFDGNERVVSMGSLIGEPTISESDPERISPETPPNVKGSTSSCDKNARSIRLDTLPVPTLLVLDNQTLSDRSFDMLASLVSRIKVEDFNTIEKTVNCLNGFEKHYLGFVPLNVDDRNSRFAMDGYLYFNSPTGMLKMMYFRLVDYINFDELFKEIQGRPDFDDRLNDLRILRSNVIDKVYSSPLQKKVET